MATSRPHKPQLHKTSAKTDGQIWQVHCSSSLDGQAVPSGGFLICADCKTEPLTPGHYCECCGTKLSLQERQGGEAPSQAGRCPSCGGASVANGVLCKACQQAFASVLGNTEVVEPSKTDSAIAGAPKAPVVVVKTATATTKAAMPIVNTAAEAITTEAFKSNTAKAVADQTAKAHLAKAVNPNPPPVARRPTIPAPPPQQSRSRTPMLVAAALVVAAIGAAEGARRLGFIKWPLEVAPEGQPVQTMAVVQNAVPAERGTAPPDPPSSAKVAEPKRASAPAPPQTAARPKSKTADERRAGRQTRSSVQSVAPVVSAPVPETTAPAATKPPAQAADSRTEPAPPTGRFFERSDVDEPPQIATRVEPQLPGNLPARAQNDVVVVRVLVSQSGHPFRVSLLRGSRLGRTADEAVVAAVTRWTFSPARKRGEPVNCWYNIGVPLAQAN